jgi:hypothetical protein
MAKKPQPQRLNGMHDPRLPAWLASEPFSEEEAEQYLDAAHRCGLDVSHWARQMLNAAAREILDLDDPGLPRR